MTTYTQNTKSISVTFGEMKVEADNVTKDTVCTVTAPKIVCNNEADAQYIKDKVNSFVNDLVKSLLNGERL